MDGRNSPSYLLWAGMKLGALGNLGGGGKSCGRSAFYTPSHVSILKPLMLSRVTLILPFRKQHYSAPPDLVAEPALGNLSFSAPG